MLLSSIDRKVMQNGKKQVELDSLRYVMIEQQITSWTFIFYSYHWSAAMAVCYRALLQPSLQGAKAVTVRVPGRHDTAHDAFGCWHFLQYPTSIFLKLLHLLTDMMVICS